MNITTHQEKEKNEETKACKRRTGEERRQVIDFKEAACCPSAIIQGAEWQRNKGECLG